MRAPASCHSRLIIILACLQLSTATASAQDCNGNGVPDSEDVGAFVSFVPQLIPCSVASPKEIASADLDADGDGDLVSRNGDQTISVFLNVDGVIACTSSYATGATPLLLTLADLDGDGSDDIVTAHSQPLRLSFLINQGDGAFGPGGVFPLDHLPRRVAANDLDGDGDVDLVVAMSQSDGALVLRNTGIGAFEIADVLTFASNAFAVYSIDLEGDGDPGLVFSSYPRGLRYYRNHGNLEFGLAASYFYYDSMSDSPPTDFTSADFDGDGDLDLAAVASSIDIFLNTGHGTLQRTTTVSVGMTPRVVIAADVDGDADPDLIVSDGYNLISYALNRGNGTFMPDVELEPSYALNRWIAPIFIDDDSRPDFAITSQTQNSVTLLKNLTVAAVSMDCDINGVPDECDILEEDCNGNGHPDACDISSHMSADCDDNGIPDECELAAQDCNANGVVDQCEVLTMHQFSSEIAVTESGAGFSLAVSDFNGDGLHDFLAGEMLFSLESALLVFTNNGDGGFSLTWQHIVPVEPYAVAAGDVDGDGDADLVAGYEQGVHLFANSGDGSFQVTGPIVSHGGSAFVLLVDLDNDNDLDIVTRTSIGTEIKVASNERGVFTSLDPISLTGSPFDAQAMDLNGDGLQDLIIEGNIPTTVLLNQGGLTFGTPVEYPVGGSGPVALLDWDGDDDLDIAVSQYYPKKIASLLNDGQGNFQAGPTVDVPFRPGEMVAVNFDGNGYTDLAIAFAPWVAVLRNGGQGVFTLSDYFPSGVATIAMAAADFDADGRADIISSAYYSYDIVLNRNVTVPATSADCNGNGVPDECEYPGCPGFTPADVNCDGVVDGLDVTPFTRAFLDGPYACAADMDQNGEVGAADVALFVGALTGGG